MNKTITIIVIAVVVIIGGYFLLRGGYQTPQETGTQTPPVPTEELETTAPKTSPEEEIQQPQTEEEGTALPTKEVTVSGTEFSFSPSTISVQPDQRVRVTFQNTGNIGHNFTLQGIGSTRTISPGQSDILEFTAPQASGNYPIRYECTLPGHSESGMVGSLVVE